MGACNPPSPHGLSVPSSLVAIATTFFSFVLYVADVATDIASLSHYLSQGAVQWAALTGAWPILALLLAATLSTARLLGDTRRAPAARTANAGGRIPGESGDVPSNNETHSSVVVEVSVRDTEEEKKSASAAEGGEERRYAGGLLHRYIDLLHRQLRARRCPSSPQLRVALLERSAALAHAQQAALQSAPQFLLQLYILSTDRGSFALIIGVCAGTSLLNLLWAVAKQTYFPAILSPQPGTSNEDQGPVKLNLINIESPAIQRPDSGHGSSIGASSTLPKQNKTGYTPIKDNTRTGSEPRSLSLPPYSGPNYQNLYNSQNLATHGLIAGSYPARPIKGHKFGSVLTLKERSLLNGGVSSATLSGGGYLKQRRSSSKDCLQRALLMLGTLLMLTARLIAFSAAALLVGPWLYMITCVHLTLMFVLVVSERPQFSSSVWKDVLHSLVTAALYCFTFVPVTKSSSRWRCLVFHLVVSTENMAACLSYYLLRHTDGVWELATLVTATTAIMLGAVLLFVHHRLHHQLAAQVEQDPESAGGCYQAHLHTSNGPYVGVAAIARPEDSCSSDAESNDSNYCSSSSAGGHPDGPAPLQDRQTGLMCSVQDLLANMSCLEEHVRDQIIEEQQIHTQSLSSEPVEANYGSEAAGYLISQTVTDAGGQVNAGNEIVELQDVVVDCSSNVRSAHVLHPRAYSRDYNEYGFLPRVMANRNAKIQFRSSANYENYPVTSQLLRSLENLHTQQMYKGNSPNSNSSNNGRNCQLVNQVLSPSSLERSVTREFDERLNLVHEEDVTRNVSSLEESSSSSACSSPSTSADKEVVYNDDRTNLDSFHESRTSPDASDRCNQSSGLTTSSVLRANDAHKELTAVSDEEIRHIEIPQVSSSSLYSSSNNTASTGYDTEIEAVQTSFHRPPLTNVEFGVIKKLPSIRRKGSSATIKAVTNNDYENIYDTTDDLKTSFETEGFVQAVISPTRRTSSSSLPKREELFVYPTQPHIPLPPRTYIIRYPYSEFPKEFLKPLGVVDQSTNSSNHDYENIPPLNVNRAMLGVRHWKTYLDIEDRVHDFSTFKDRSKIDSTTMSSLQSDNSVTRNVPRPRPLSIVDDGDSVLSRSLPDLSNLVLEACIEVPEQETPDNPGSQPQTTEQLPDNARLLSVLNTLRANKPLRSNSVDNLSNYETLWVSHLEENDDQSISICTKIGQPNANFSNEHSSLINTINDVRTKGSMCNLYYSTMSDLSRRFYSESLRRQSSIASTTSQRSSREASHSREPSSSAIVSKPLPEIIECNEEQENQNNEEDAEKTLLDVEQPNKLQPRTNSQEIKVLPKPLTKSESQATLTALNDRDEIKVPLTPNKESDVNTGRTKRKFSTIRDKFDGPMWTPLKSPLKLHSPAKAIQAGIRAFNRPRVHVITPNNEVKQSPGKKLKSPFKSKSSTANSSPSINVNMTDNIEIRIRHKNDNGIEHVTVKRTPLKAEPPTSVASIKTVQKTPKTSTPDNGRHMRQGMQSTDTTASETMANAPKHSTPEAREQHLPQISAISGLSSVMESPELSRISSTYGVPKHYSSTSGFPGIRRVPLSENIRQYDRLNRPPSMAAIKEVEGQCLDMTAARLNAVSKNIYSAIQNRQTHGMNYESLSRPLLNHLPYQPLSKMEQYKENVFLAPYNVPYGVSSQRSTLSPNSKIFDKKL